MERLDKTYINRLLIYDPIHESYLATINITMGDGMPWGYSEPIKMTDVDGIAWEDIEGRAWEKYITEIGGE